MNLLLHRLLASRHCPTRRSARDAVRARTPAALTVLLATFLGLAACDGATGPDPHADLYGEYDLYLYNGFPLPVHIAGQAGTGLQGGILEGGTLLLRSDRSYVWTEDRVGAGFGFTFEGRYDAADSTVTLLDAGWNGEQVRLRHAPGVLTTRNERDPTSPALEDSTVYVRKGQEPPARFSYRTYELISYEGEPVPFFDPERSISVSSGHLWLFEAGHLARVTSEDGFLRGYRGAAYAIVGDTITLDPPWGPASGIIRGDTLELGPYGYVQIDE